MKIMKHKVLYRFKMAACYLKKNQEVYEQLCWLRVNVFENIIKSFKLVIRQIWREKTKL